MSRFGNVLGTAIRADWGTAVRIGEHLWRIRLENPVGPLMVNTYVYASGGRVSIIDPGWPWTLDALELALRELDIAHDLAEVDQFLYTHTHIDHMGGAALLQDRSDALHFAPASAAGHFESWHSFQDSLSDWSAWATEAFDDPGQSDVIHQSVARRRRGGVEFLVEAHGDRGVHSVELLSPGDRVDVGDLSLQVVDARGHDPHHVAFWEGSRGWLFAGDAVIATPTPICRAMGDDLLSYEETLHRLQGLGANLLLPGHGVQRAGALEQMFDRSRTYILQYREGVLGALRDAPRAMELSELALALTPRGEPLEPRGRWFVHLALVDSHVRTLASDGAVEVHDGPRYALP